VIRVLVVHRERSTAEGIAAGLGASDDVESAGSARDVATTLQEVERPGSRIDIVVASADLPGNGVLELAETLRGRENRPALVVTGLPSTDAVLVRYLEAGVDGYLTDELSLSGLLLVLRLLNRDEVLVGPSTARLLVRRLHALAGLLATSGLDLSALSELTPREGEVLDLIGEGLTNREIGRRLFIGVGTVKSHVHSLLGKLDVRDREEARKLLILSRTSDAALEDPGLGRGRQEIGSTDTNQA